MCACSNPDCRCRAAEPEAAAPQGYSIERLAESVLPSLEQRLAELETRCAALEADRDRFLAALKGAAGMCLKNPVVASMLPKQMRDDLKKYVV